MLHTCIMAPGASPCSVKCLLNMSFRTLEVRCVRPATMTSQYTKWALQRLCQVLRQTLSDWYFYHGFGFLTLTVNLVRCLIINHLKVEYWSLSTMTSDYCIKALQRLTVVLDESLYASYLVSLWLSTINYMHYVLLIPLVLWCSTSLTMTNKTIRAPCPIAVAHSASTLTVKSISSITLCFEKHASLASIPHTGSSYSKLSSVIKLWEKFVSHSRTDSYIHQNYMLVMYALAYDGAGASLVRVSINDHHM